MVLFHDLESDLVRACRGPQDCGDKVGKVWRSTPRRFTNVVAGGDTCIYMFPVCAGSHSQLSIRVARALAPPGPGSAGMSDCKK